MKRSPILQLSSGHIQVLNPLKSTLISQSNGPLYRNTVIGTLAVDGWGVTSGTARRGLDPPSPLLAVPNVTVWYGIVGFNVPLDTI